MRRPDVDQREVLESGDLNITVGLIGDNWSSRNSPHPDKQLNIMNSRVVDLVACQPDRRPLAGDQLYVDMDVSKANLSAGTRLSLGEAIIEVTGEPHNGCAKFAERFGRDALIFVNNAAGTKHCLRGINAKVVHSGTIHTGNHLSRLESSYFPKL